MERKKIALIYSMMALIIISMVSCSVLAFAENGTSENVIPGLEAGDALMAPSGDETNSSDVRVTSGIMDTATVTADEPSGKDESVTVMSLLDIIKKGGIVGYLIILLSITSLGLIIDYSITIRKAKILPPKDAETFDKIIKARNLNEIEKLDNNRSSFFAQITIAGLKESKMGYQSMIKAMEDTGGALTSGIARKIEHLNVIGNISPMMGLLGTVIGMLRCFNEIAHMAGAIEPKQLAGGIFEALVTTCLGLIVAIPSLYAYAVFKNRIDEYTGEAALAAEQIVAPFKTNPHEKE